MEALSSVLAEWDKLSGWVGVCCVREEVSEEFPSEELAPAVVGISALFTTLPLAAASWPSNVSTVGVEPTRVDGTWFDEEVSVSLASCTTGTELLWLTRLPRRLDAWSMGA